MTVQEDRRSLPILKKIPLLKSLEREELAELAAEATVTEYRRRRLIYIPGDPGDAVYFIGEGRVKISRVTSDGKELTIAYRTQGEVFGELCVLDGGPREEMAETADPTVALAIPRERFDRLVAEHLPLAYAFARQLMERRQALERRIEDLIFRDVNSKLAELLLLFAERNGIADPRGTLIGTKVTHQEMANLIGSTRETVSLTLSQFRRKKLIITESRRVIVVDKEGLQALV